MKTLFLAILLSFPVAAKAQDYDRSVHTLDTLLQSIARFWDKELEAQQSIHYPVNLSLENIFSCNDSLLNVFSKKTELNEVLVKQLSDDYGLQLFSGFQFNNANGMNDDLFTYYSRYQLGMEWSILKGSLLENNTDKKKLLLENTLLAADEIKKQQERKKVYLLHKILLLFGEQQYLVLKERQQILAFQFGCGTQLFFLKMLAKEELMKIKTKLNHNEELLKIFEPYFLLSSSPSFKNIPVPDVHFPAIENWVKKSSLLNDSLSAVMKEIASLENSLLKKINLSSYARYNLLNTGFPQQSSFMSYGISFSMPLQIKPRYKEKSRLEYEYRYSKEWEEQQMRTEAMFSSLYKFRSFQTEYYKLNEEADILGERVRQFSAKENFKMEDFTPFQGLTLLETSYEQKAKLLLQMQKMYGEALFMYCLMEKKETMDLLKESAAQAKTIRKNKTIYLWSKSFDHHPLSFIHEYLKYNEIDEVLVSAGPGAEKIPAINALMKMKGNYSFSVMIANNKLFDNDYMKEIKILSDNLKNTRFTGIHLDVEPHVLDEWESNKEALLDRYVTMLKEISGWCRSNGLQLSVSVPKHYPEPVLKQIYVLCDKVYIMAYENTDPDFVAEKIKEEIGISLDKTVLALRAKDFPNRLEMELAAEKIMHETQVKYIAYHDFETMVALDNVMLR